MTTEIATENEEHGLVESFRATGYSGREPWIPALDAVTGTRVVAIRQLEACATYPVCAWRDDVADEPGLWSFMRECLLKPLLSFARIVESSIPTGWVSGNANRDNHLALARTIVGKLLERLVIDLAKPVLLPDLCSRLEARLRDDTAATAKASGLSRT